uniref:(2E,6E)-farnesyl diphosphate synthase n=1 Tax=Junco hyemalis TaxID=40217 RepID=A0A8C5J7V4_JUNHY
MDSSLTRRGQLCWYKKEGIGLDAINDAFLLESSVYRLLRRYCGQQPFYLHLLELFLQVSLAPQTLPWGIPGVWYTETGESSKLKSEQLLTEEEEEEEEEARSQGGSQGEAASSSSPLCRQGKSSGFCSPSVSGSGAWDSQQRHFTEGLLELASTGSRFSGHCVQPVCSPWPVEPSWSSGCRDRCSPREMCCRWMWLRLHRRPFFGASMVLPRWKCPGFPGKASSSSLHTIQLPASTKHPPGQGKTRQDKPGERHSRGKRDGSDLAAGPGTRAGA